MRPDQISVQPTFLGGGFGRKFESDFVVEAALASKKVGRPVKLIWSRSEDIRYDFYRPAVAARMRAVLQDGSITSWQARNTGSSPLLQRNPSQNFDPLAVDGFINLLYGLPNREISFRHVDFGIPVGFWRSVGMSQNCFFVERFIDEIAAKDGQDPLTFRQNLLRDQPEAAQVLEELALMSGWNSGNENMGLALTLSHGSLIGAVAHMQPTSNGKWQVVHLDAVVDCGIAINPKNIKAQIAGGMLYGLAAAIYGDLPISGGRVSFDNFFGSTNLRLANAPSISVRILENLPNMGGIGEPGTAVIAPTVANALSRATGQQLRKLPLTQSGLI